MLKVTEVPKEGEVINILSSNPPPVNSQVEFIKGKRAVAIGIVIERYNVNYKALVVMSEAGPQQ